MQTKRILEFGSKEKIFILGAGSNILFTDKIFNGFVIKLGKNFNNISLLPNDIIIAGAAVTDKKLSDFALENEIGGFEFLSCIPGTIGGGLKINSGCYGREFKDILVSIQVIDREGNIRTIPSSKIKLTNIAMSSSDSALSKFRSPEGMKSVWVA